MTTWNTTSGLFLVTVLSGCTGWQVQSATPAQTLADPQYATKTVRLTTGRRGHVYLSHPAVTRDSVSGHEGDTPASFALTDVQEVATRHPATAKSVLLVSGAAIVVGGIALIAAYGNSLGD